MIKIERILETEPVNAFLLKRWLFKQYKKSKSYILAWIYWKNDFKLRKSKENWEWSFRINKQFRAFWKVDNKDLIIYMIDNYQK